MKRRFCRIGLLAAFLAAGAVAASVSFAGDVRGGLVHYWSCTGSPSATAVKDVVGGKSGQLLGGAALVKDVLANPKYDAYSIYLPNDGKNSAVETAVSQEFAVKGGFTIAGWIRMEEGTKVGHLIGNYPGGGFQPGFFRIGLEISPNGGGHEIRFEAADDLNENFQVIAPYDWQYGKWFHLTATLSPTETSVFINGKLVAAQPAKFLKNGLWLSHPPLRLMLGAVNIDAQAVLKENPATVVEGKHYISNVRIYSRTLSKAEVAKLYQYELERKKGK